MALVRAARVAEIPAGSIKEVQVAGTPVALANVGGKLYAINNTCLHRGGPLGQGQLEGSVVTCPWHGWQFDVTTGKAVMNPAASVGCFATELQGEEVYVDLG
ncbi:MAG TPA: Rieske 2Fe-2S domain-containing protein [Candidatus Eisenbacteria bacterium]|jgi:nitrite reductase/ring-hydroxylating ferredoxin subunit|nr:Rieske 2Fe-2S domain-containing protein [Candidatus Eisenbacteria bacterium]